jgi:hypothetical protein
MAIERAFFTPDANVLIANPGGSLMEFSGRSRGIVMAAINPTETQTTNAQKIRPVLIATSAS